MGNPNQSPNTDNAYLAPHARLLLNSFKKLTGRVLLETNGDDAELAKALYEANFVVVSHGIETDPIFNYANKTAQQLFEMTWAEFVKLPSRLSAEALHRDERARLMQLVSAQGYIDDYAGIRVSKSGRRFRIDSATVWNLLDGNNSYRGQAATFAHWENLEAY